MGGGDLRGTYSEGLGPPHRRDPTSYTGPPAAGAREGSARDMLSPSSSQQPTGLGHLGRPDGRINKRPSEQILSDQQGILKGVPPHGPCSLASRSCRCEVGAPWDLAGRCPRGRPARGGALLGHLILPPAPRRALLTPRTFTNPFPLPGLSGSSSSGPRGPHCPGWRHPAGSPRSVPGPSPVANTTPPGHGPGTFQSRTGPSVYSPGPGSSAPHQTSGSQFPVRASSEDPC